MILTRRLLLVAAAMIAATPLSAAPAIVDLPVERWDFDIRRIDGKWNGEILISKSARSGYREWELRRSDDLSTIEAGAFLAWVLDGRMADRMEWHENHRRAAFGGTGTAL